MGGSPERENKSKAGKGVSRSGFPCNTYYRQQTAPSSPQRLRYLRGDSLPGHLVAFVKFQARKLEPDERKFLKKKKTEEKNRPKSALQKLETRY